MNPYSTQKPLNDPGMFWGPAVTLHQILSCLANRQNVSLVGIHYSGKTSLLHLINYKAIYKRFGHELNHDIFLYIDMHHCLRKTCDEFFDLLSEEIISASKKHFSITPFPKRGEDGFAHILKQVKEQGYHITLTLDTFDSITLNKAFDPEFFMFLRAQASVGLINYITASILPLDQISHPALHESPFFNIFAVYPVELLTLEEVTNLLTIPSQKEGYSFSDKEKSWILKVAGRFPFFIQYVCHYMIEEKAKNKDSKENEKRIPGQIYKELLPHFDFIWKGLNEKQQADLKEEAQHYSGSNPKMPELSESRLFRKYVRDRFQLSFFHMSSQEIEEELKVVLKHLDSLTFLADSKLKYLKAVIKQCEEKNLVTVLEKGRVINEILKETFELLKGPGSRSDNDPFWMNYNILYYSYFRKVGLSQKLIAGRLNISLRHYHRKKEEAIRELSNCLLDSEAKAEARYKGGDDEEAQNLQI